MPGLRFHDLRHHAITELAENGASDGTIKSIAGHVSQKMLEHYSHISLNIGMTGSPASQKSLIWIHAISKPDAAWAGLQGSAQTRPESHYLPPRFDIIL